jgi:ABC-type nitrate/sulfonate/bicarbonate transport system ATPase subunit
MAQRAWQTVIVVRHCRHAFPRQADASPVPVLDDVNLRVDAGEVVCLLGPSGCGKTTLLRVLAGLVLPDDGEVLIDGHAVAGPGPDRGMVFQDHALLPWADVLANVAFGLAVRGVPRQEREARAARLLGMVGLAGFERAYPRQLSGGMQQRVGLARALAIDPAILLMDEPFGSLDSQTRRALQEDLLRIHLESRKTIVFVTHSVDEAARLGDRIVLLGPRPARVEAEFEVSLPRPRMAGLDSVPAFVELKRELWSRLRQQSGASS